MVGPASMPSSNEVTASQTLCCWRSVAKCMHLTAALTYSATQILARCIERLTTDGLHLYSWMCLALPLSPWPCSTRTLE